MTVAIYLYLQDLSTEKMTISLGAMDKCGAGEGWQGTGASGDPYRFHLSGESDADRISVAYNSKFESLWITYSIWFKSNGIWDTDGEVSVIHASFYLIRIHDSDSAFNLTVSPSSKAASP